MAKFDVVGHSVRRPDAYDKVTGGRGFPVNVTLPGMLHARMLRSPYAHARIRSINASAAEKLAGVKAVLTPGDVPQKKFSPLFFMPTESNELIRDLVLLSENIRYAGQPVAAVAASTPDIAEAALDLIDVDYEELTAVFDPEEAMQPGAPRISPTAANNIARTPTLSRGDLEAGFREADEIFEGTYCTQRVHTCYMEPRVCVVDSDMQGNLTVYASVQHIFGLREKLAYVLSRPESGIKVVKSPYIGGGFGSKLDLVYIEPLAALLSLKTRRPVRMEHTRYEDFITNARHPMKVYLKTGVKKDGTFTARYAKTIVDTGAYATHGPEVIMVHAVFSFFSAYRCPHQKWDGVVVYTNNMLGGAFRGYGAPQGCWAVESQIDEICHGLKMDPLEFRLKNAHHEGDAHPFLKQFTLASYRLADCINQGAERIGWKNRSRTPSGAGTKRRGIGVACHPLWVSGCVGLPDIYEHSGAIVKLNRDGTADLATATIDMGTGQNTTLCQIAAEELGIAAESVRMSYADTDTVPFDAPSHASRVTYSAGNAVKAAAGEARRRLLQVAGEMLEADAADLEVRKGIVQVKGSPDVNLTVAEVVSRAESPLVQMTAAGPKVTTIKEKGSIIGVSSMAPPGNPSPCAAEFVEVEVDTETGAVKVLRVVYAHDIGRVINPAAAQGQVEGGVQQGIGYALMEHLQFDPGTGACVTGDFLDYKMPTAVEMPAEIESIFIESDEPTGPFGAKGLSEVCLTIPAPAIANAIFNAVGVRVRDLPITPEKILAGLGKL
ncbi:MAG: molybdopterin-dependent oxidoreductase [Gammaproteobacteria bacterium]|nr:molybdopterin-dependent oxidoreductase [Gammaproteobacteria bacterium]